MMNKSFIVIVGVIVAVGAAAWGNVDITKAMLKVPEEERLAFLKYHAERGYQLATSGEVPDYQMGLPDDFSIKVYRTLSASSSKNIEALDALSCIICWAGGKCVDLCDPGVHPQ